MARTKILSVIENKEMTAKEIAKKCKISYYSSIYHLHSLNEEKIVTRFGKKPYKWKATSRGQQKLVISDQL